MRPFLSLLLLVCCNLSASAQEIKYYDAAEFPVYGKTSDATESRYVRLPDSLQTISRESIWNLSRNSSGLAIRFSSDSPVIAARWTSLLNYRMNHMTDTGVRGLDLYILEDGEQWRFANCARPGFEKDNETVIIKHMDPVEREYMLYLPLYDGVTALEIGIDAAYSISGPKIDMPRRSKPVVFYGSSILQGACASRPGMAFTNIISRQLDIETINLGFSGNALLDYDVAGVMAGVDAGCYVLDFVPNASVEQIREKAEHFYNIIRNKNPLTPIIFIEDPEFTHSRFDQSVAREIREKNEALDSFFTSLIEKGEQNIYYLPSQGMLGDDGEATIDGVHFTDIGMVRYSDLVRPMIELLLGLE